MARKRRRTGTTSRKLMNSTIRSFWNAMISLVKRMERDLASLRLKHMASEYKDLRLELCRTAKSWTNSNSPGRSKEHQSTTCTLAYCRKQIDQLNERVRNMRTKPIPNNALQLMEEKSETLLETRNKSGEESPREIYCCLQKTLKEETEEESSDEVSSDTSSGNSESPDDSQSSLDHHPLFLFDPEGYPLCDRKGRVLVDSGGSPLLGLDQDGHPVSDARGNGVYDYKGRPPQHPEFDPALTQNRLRPERLYGGKLQVYDRCGHPLLDREGRVLYTAGDEPLITLNNGGIVDVYKNRGAFDDRGIPLVQIEGRWLNPRGTALRLYDVENRPLTNKDGTELYDTRGKRMIIEDEAGRPLYDSQWRLVRDVNGISASGAEFDPTQKPQEDDRREIRVERNTDRTPVVLYDAKGRPLTNLDGAVLADSRGQNLVRFGRERVPFSDLEGCPLYAPGGHPLETRALLTMIGRHPGGDCDSDDNPASDRSARHYDPRDRQIYTVSALETLKNETIKRNRSEVPGQSLVTPNMAEVDSFNRPLYNLNGEPQFDRFGRPKYDLRGRKLFGKCGLPVMDSRGGRLNEAEDGRGEGETSCQRGPCLYNGLGVPAVDRYGRPLFDEATGRPLASQTGLPLSAVVKNARPMEQPVSVVDALAIVNLPAPVARSLESLSIDTGRLYTSIPQEYSLIPPDWIDKGEPSGSEMSPKSRADVKTYQSLIRITKFETGQPVYELLELVRYTENTSKN